MLQLITRKKAVDPSLMQECEIGLWVRSMWMETGDIFKIIDSSLIEEVLDTNSNVHNQVKKVLSIALSCTEEDPHMRPTMEQVTKELENDFFSKELEQDSNVERCCSDLIHL